MNERNTAAVDRILVQIQGILNEAKSVPFRSDLCIVDRDLLLNMLEDAAQNLPGDIAQARSLVQKKERIISDANVSAEQTISKAKADAEKIVAAAQERADNLVAEDSITIAAKKQAKEIYEANDAKVTELKHHALNYINSILGKANDAFSDMQKELAGMQEDIKAVNQDIRSLNSKN